jgi:hypothetical protein
VGIGEILVLPQQAMVKLLATSAAFP